MYNNHDNMLLRLAHSTKNGEFFMVKDEVSLEMPHYLAHLKGKKVYIPNTKFTTELAERDSFVQYFSSRSMMEKFGIKELSYSYYDEEGRFVLITVADGSFTKEIIANNHDDTRLFYVFKQIDKVDVVIGNPEGSKANDLFSYVFLSGKDYIFSVCITLFSNKLPFLAFKKNSLKFGFNTPTYFYDVDSAKVKKFCNKVWITSFDNGRVPSDITTFYDINSYDYPKYDNYDAIDVKCIKMIPMGFDGVMGVPVTSIMNLNRNQIEIVGLFNAFADCDYDNGFICGDKTPYSSKGKTMMTSGPVIDNKAVFARVLVRFIG